MFAKRDFKRGEKILIDKYLMRDVADEVPDCARWALDQLSPVDGNLVEKFFNNAWGGGMFVTGSRFNHACIGSCGMVPLTKTDAGSTAFFAVRDILAQEEITMSYTRLSSHRYISNPACQDRKDIHASIWGFTCHCQACTDPSIMKLVEEVERLNVRVDLYWDSLGRHRGFRYDSIFLHIGRRLIELYDRLQMCQERYMFIYFDMFQVAIRDRKTVPEGLRYLKLAQDHLLMMNSEKVIFGGMDEQLRVYADDHTKHRWYLINDRK